MKSQNDKYKIVLGEKYIVSKEPVVEYAIIDSCLIKKNRKFYSFQKNGYKIIIAADILINLNF